MKKLLSAAAALAALALAIGLALLFLWAPERPLPALAAPPRPDPAMVAAGARVVALGDCMVCHTSARGLPYAGGLPLKTQFGTIHSTNITPDPETGIGLWSRDAFRRALRHGVARDGHLLYPAFPYTHYTRMSDGDIDAAWHYLMSRTPVHAEPRANDLPFPLTYRPLLAFWNALYLRPGDSSIAPPSGTLAPPPGTWAPPSGTVAPPSGTVAPPPGTLAPPSDTVAPPPGTLAQPSGMLVSPSGTRAPLSATPATPVARGRYLADTLGHCASCHSGLTLAGGERSPAFGGGTIDGWTAPALTRLASGPAPWTERELAQYLRTGLSSAHGAAKGPMRPVTERLGDVPAEDVDALAAWLMSIQRPAAPTHASAAGFAAATVRPAAVLAAATVRPTAVLAAATVRPADGAALFGAACAGCHASAAPMMRLAGRPALARSSAVLGDSPATFVQTLLQGIAWPTVQRGETGPFMPPFAAALSDAQIASLAAWVRADAGLPPWPDTERTSARLRKELNR